jgi:hypothetical protein
LNEHSSQDAQEYFERD